MSHAAIILLIAFGLDFLWGDPPYRLHPIRLMGSTVTILEKLLRRLGLSGLLGGTLLVTFVVGLFVTFYIIVHSFLVGLHPWLATIFDLYLVYSCLALTDLLEHAVPVARALEKGDLLQARIALRSMVGRDVGLLNSAAVARGAVESVAENFVDGVVSPLFWYSSGALLSLMVHWSVPTTSGVCFILCFKAISTLDSMVGYRHDHYLLFGRPAAKLDDLANFIPARLSLIILLVGASISGQSGMAGWKIARRDRLKHLSPNAGHPESFVAGVLGIKLGGPAVYQKETVEKQWLGDGDAQAGPQHIRRCCRLIFRSGWFACLAFVAALLGLGALFR